MAKLSKEQQEKLKSIGITGCKTEADSREKMVEKMVDLGIDDDGEEWEDIFDIVSTLLDDPEAENDDLAEEVAASNKKSKSKKKVEEEEEEDDEEEEDEDEDSDDEDEDSDDEDEDSDDEEEDEEEEEEPVKKSSKKSDSSNKKSKEVEKPAATKKTGKKEEKAAEKPKATAADKTKSAKTTSTGKTSKRLNPKENEEDAKLYDGLKKALSKLGEFEFNFIANGGVSIKYLGENSTKVLFSFDSPKLTDGKVIGRVYSSAIKTEDELINLFGEDFEIKQDWSGIPIMSEISLEEIIEATKENKDEFVAFLKKLEGKDVKLGKNREKMEASLKESQKEKAEDIKKKKKTAAPKEEPAPEPTKKAKKKVVEEEEEEEEKPAKKSSKKTGNKKK